MSRIGGRSVGSFWAFGVVVWGLLAVLACEPAWGQSGSPTLNELRRENAALRARVDQLEAQLDRANETIGVLREEVSELTGEVGRLREAWEARGVSAPAGEAESGEVETGPVYAEVDPEAPLESPAAMLASLKGSFERAMEGRSLESDGDLGRYVREVRRWARMQRRDVRGDVEWVIEVTGVLSDEPGGAELEYRVLDRESLLPYSDRRWVLELPRRLTSRYLASPDQPLWLLRGSVRARPRVDVEREEMGFFDFPAFIGPFAEFGFELEAEEIRRWPVVDGEEDG